MGVSLLFGAIATATASVMIGFGAAAIMIGVGAAGLMSYAMDGMMDDMAVDTMSNRNTSSKATVADRQVVYGRCRTGGVIVYENTSGSSYDTEKNKYLHQIIVFSEGEVEEIDTVYLDDTIAAEADSNGDFRYKNRYKKSQGTDLRGKELMLIKKKGTQDQNANSVSGNVGDGSTLQGELPSEWTTSHKLLGCAYVYAQMRHDPEIYESKIPTISAILKGRKVYNPTYDQTESDWQVGSNTGSNKNDPDTWAWTDNPVLILLDYMMNDEFGMGESLDAFDAATAKESIEWCDDTITLPDSSTEKRFTCNGIVTTANSHRKNIENILSSMNGQLLYSNGKYHIKAYKFTTAVSRVIDESIMTGSFDVVTKTSRRDLYNRVKGKFCSAEHDYEMTEYPHQLSDYVDENYPIVGRLYEYDDGETLPMDYDLPMTTSNTMAQRLAYLLLLRSRFQTVVKFDTNLKGLMYTVGDNVKITNTALGYNQKIFQIVNLTVKPSADKGVLVTIEAQDNAASIYTHNLSTLRSFATSGTMTVGGPVSPPTNLVVDPVIAMSTDGSMAFDVSFTASDDGRIDHYRLRYRHLHDTELQNVNLGTETNYRIHNLENGEEYLIEITAFTANGKKSSVIQGFFTYTMPLDLPPQAISLFQSNLDAPSITDLTDLLGRDPVSGDQVYLIEVNENDVPIDSVLYVFEPLLEIVYVDADNYSKLSTDSDNARLSFDVIYKVVGPAPTWSYETLHTGSAYEKNYGDANNFQGINYLENTINGYPSIRYTITLTQYEHDNSGNTGSSVQKGDFRVTATANNQSSSEDIYIMNQIFEV